MTIRAGRHFGIGGRLGLAFSLSALLAVIACIIGWLSYERISGSIRQIGEDDLPVASAAARLAQFAGAVTATAPLLSQAASGEQVEQLSIQLRERLGGMRSVLVTPRGATFEPTLPLVDQLAGNLEAIRAETLVVLALRQRNDVLLREVRALHSDFVEEAEPLVDDARFLVQSQLESIETRTAEPFIAREVRSQIRKAEAILQASSHANLAVGLLSRLASVGTTEQLALDGHFLAEALDLIRAQLPIMEDASDTLTLRQVLLRLVDISVLDSGLPALRRLELAQQQKITDLLAQNRMLVGQLDQRIAQIIATASERAAVSGQMASESIALGRNLLALIAAIAVLASLVMAIAYVRGSLIGRIRTLADAARALADGRVPPPIEVRGSDELADMARAMEGFRRTQNELVQSAKLAALGHLSAGIAHELNQPLNAIRSQAHNAMVMQERGDIAGVTRALQRVQDLTARAGHVVGHLRRFSRRSDLELVPVRVLDAVEGAALILESRFRETGAELVIEVGGGLKAEADDIRLEQVLVNLVSNAVDAVASHPHGIVRIGAEHSNNLVRIFVGDNGPGLSKDVTETLFDPFVTTKPPGEGVGLGLTISYNIVRDFGGALTVQSDGSGTIFTVELRAVNDP